MSQGSSYPYPPPLEYAPVQPGRRRWLNRGLFSWVLFIGLAIMTFLLLNGNRGNYQSASLTRFRGDLLSGQVRSVTVSGDDLMWIPVRPPAPVGNAPPARGFSTSLPAGASGNWAFTQWLLENANGAQVYVDNNQNLLMSLIVPLIPWVLIFAFIYLFVFRQLRKRTVQVTPPPFAAAPPYAAAPAYATVPPND